MRSGAFESEISGKDLRSTQYADLVDCYRNLNQKNCFSLKQVKGALKGKVTGYARSVILQNPNFIVNEKSRERILIEKRRNVHASVRGAVVHANSGDLILSQLPHYIRTTYSPYVMNTFFRLERADGAIVQSSVCRFDDASSYRYAAINGSDVFLFNA